MPNRLKFAPNVAAKTTGKLTISDDIARGADIATDTLNSTDIELSFGENVFENSSNKETQSKVKKLVQFLQKLCKEFSLNQLTVGFEPISDTELNLLVINSNEICICTEMDDMLSHLIKNDICWDELD